MRASRLYVPRLWVVATALVAAVFLIAALLIALTVPYREWDALSFGEWSRLIAEQGGLRFDGISASHYHRPLFYVLQGWVWGAFSFSFWSGRVLSWGFGVLFVLAVAVLAARAGGRLRTYSAALCVLLALSVPALARYFSAGMTDVPVAALVGAAALALWTPRLGRFGPPTVAVLACLAVLAKPTALVALAGLGVAHALGTRAGLRDRVVCGIVPLAGGIGVALVYDLLLARYTELGLVAFLRAGVDGGYYTALAGATRWDALFELSLLGPNLRLPLVFAVVYGIARCAGLAHRQAGIGSLGGAVGATLLVPRLAEGASSSLSSTTGVIALATFFALGAAAALAPARLAPSRLWLARLLVFASPVVIAWLLYAAFDPRLASPAWAALVALIAVALAPGVQWVADEAPRTALVPLAALVLLVLQNIENIDGLGRSAWREYGALGAAGVWDERRVQEVVQPEFQEVLDLVRSQTGPPDRVYSSDGKLRFFFPGRVTQVYPRRCADLVGYRVFVLLTDPVSRDYLEREIGASGDPAAWAACESPRLQQLSSGANGWAVFTVTETGS